MVPARRTLDREVQRWEAANPGELSQLPDELAAAMEDLAVHPYVGRHVSGRPGNYRKLQLRRIGFFITYRIHPRLRIIQILALIPKASLAHRR